MKKNKVNEKNTNKIVSNCYYLGALCFYGCSLLNFINENMSVGVMYLCLGSSLLCLGSVYYNKHKDKKDDHNKK